MKDHGELLQEEVSEISVPQQVRQNKTVYWSAHRTNFGADNHMLIYTRYTEDVIYWNKFQPNVKMWVLLK